MRVITPLEKEKIFLHLEQTRNIQKEIFEELIDDFDNEMKSKIIDLSMLLSSHNGDLNII